MDKSQYIQPREYEMMTVLLPDQGDEETQSAIDAVLGYITDQNGTVDSVNADSPWGRRRLAYTVRHEGVDYRDGHYVLVYFTALPSALTEIERELKLDTSVIRYLILIHDPEMGEKIDESQTAVEGEDAAEAVETNDAPVADAGEAVEAEDAPAADTEEAVAEETAAPAAEEAPAEDVAAEEEAPVVEAAAEEAPEAEAEEETEAAAEESDKE